MEKTNGRTFLVSPDLSILAGIDTNPCLNMPSSAPNIKCHKLLLDCDDVCPNCPIIESLRDGKVHQSVVQLPSGRTLHSCCYPLKNAENDVEMVVLQTSEFFLKTAAEPAVPAAISAPCLSGYWEEDFLTGAFYCSDTILQLTGHSPQAVIPKDGFAIISDFIHPEDRQCYEKYVLSAYQNRKSHDFIFRGIGEAGEVRYVWEKGAIVCEADGEPARAFGTLTDVTRQVSSAMAAEAQMSYLQLFAQVKTPLAILTRAGLDSCEFKLMEMNPMFQKVFTGCEGKNGCTVETVFPGTGAHFSAELMKVRYGKHDKFPMLHLNEDGRIFDVRAQFLSPQLVMVVFTETTDYYNKAQYLFESERRWAPVESALAKCAVETEIEC